MEPPSSSQASVGWLVGWLDQNELTERRLGKWRQNQLAAPDPLGTPILKGGANFL